MGKRGRQPWDRSELPVGTIRIRQHSRRVKARMIKVRSDGPKGRRWMTLARYWWLMNRGPVPPGMRVVHRDGDFLNDNPDNLVLATAGDVLYLARLWDATLAARNAEACRRATALCNRERARIRRVYEFFADRWYAVDPVHRHVVNVPYRTRIELFRAHVDPAAQSPNGAGLIAAWLGWPGLAAGEALVLAVLERPLRLPAIAAAVDELCRRQNWRVRTYPAETLRTIFSQLRRRGFLLSIGRPGTEYSRSEAATAARGYPLPYVAARGAEVAAGRFGTLAKLEPGRCS